MSEFIAALSEMKDDQGRLIITRNHVRLNVGLPKNITDIIALALKIISQKEHSFIFTGMKRWKEAKSIINQHSNSFVFDSAETLELIFETKMAQSYSLQGLIIAQTLPASRVKVAPASPGQFAEAARKEGQQRPHHGQRLDGIYVVPKEPEQ
jgi:hypothetical protein